jgi:hypothetical protein
MGLGAIIGMTIVSDAALREGPAGDTAGAAGALMVLLCVTVGFAVSILTVIVAKALHRGTPRHILLRTGLSITGGGVIGALALNSGTAATVAAWLLLLGVPLLLSCSRREPAPSGIDATAK